jgi:hypothetical protein
MPKLARPLAWPLGRYTRPFCASCRMLAGKRAGAGRGDGGGARFWGETYPASARSSMGALTWPGLQRNLDADEGDELDELDDDVDPDELTEAGVLQLLSDEIAFIKSAARWDRTPVTRLRLAAESAAVRRGGESAGIGAVDSLRGAALPARPGRAHGRASKSATRPQEPCPDPQPANGLTMRAGYILLENLARKLGISTVFNSTHRVIHAGFRPFSRCRSQSLA